MIQDEAQYYLVESANPANRIEEAAQATGMPIVALCDEEAGGVVAYLSAAHAEEIVARLNR